MKTAGYFFSILLQVISLGVFSQKQLIRFEHLSTDQGLSQSNVICILQDSRGFMWFGTRDGLNKYDGYNFTVYKHEAGNPHSLSNNFIRAIIETRNGDVWIGTQGGGLCLYNRGKNRFTSFRYDPKNNSGISNDFVTSLLEDSNGNIWVGTEKGLNLYDAAQKKFIHYTYNSSDNNSIADSYVRYVFEDSDHDVWVCTFSGGLNLFNRGKNTFTRFQYDGNNKKSISSNSVYTMFEDSRKRLWVGTNGGGLNLFNKKSGEFVHYRHDNKSASGLPADYIYAINEDREHHLWIGTENGGLAIFNPEKGSFYNYQHEEADPTSLSNNSVYAIYKDTKSNMWLGTFTGGVDLVNPDARKFAHYRHVINQNSLSHNNVLCIYEDSKKNIWVGTDGGGLNLFDPQTGKFTYFRHNPNNINSICGDYVLSVCEDSKGNLWVGTWADGVTVFSRSGGSYKHFKNKPGDASTLSNNNAWKIFEDKRGNIWVGTYGGGLNLFNPATGSFIRYQHDESDKNSLSNNNIYSLFEDSEGQLWVSTDGGGLNLFKGKDAGFSHFVHNAAANSISDNSVGVVCEDVNKNLWIGTMGGLSFFDKKNNRFENYTIANGLPNNVIFGILEDSKGKLWISTNKGISCFNPQNKTFKNFGVSDGLQASEFKLQAFCKSHSGEMYFGGTNGFNLFVPDSIKSGTYTPPLVITGFQIFNKEVPIASDTASSPLKQSISETREITIPYASSVISFEFASLNYTVQEKKQYAYMLEGFDEKWNHVGTRRTATYTNLDPGKYFFKVKGLDNDGSWSETTAGFQLIITPPFWLTWWFKLLAAVSVGGMAISIHWLRMKTVNAQKRKLEKQVAELLDKAVAQGKYEIASDVMHDIGNAVVGFGSYLTRIRRLHENENAENLRNLAVFFEEQKILMSEIMGEAKAGALVKMLKSMAQTQKNNQEEVNKAVTEQVNIITHIQEILNIQRQYINGHETQERKPVNVKSIINDSVSMLLASIDRAGIAISLNIADNIPEIRGDRTRLMQVILNVLKNSIESIDANAQEKLISVNAYTQHDRFLLQVKDTGSGFDESVADRIFSKGFTTKSSGSGLGLYNCRTIVESHEGAIDITSEGPGRGSLTTISFKINAVKEAPSYEGKKRQEQPIYQPVSREGFLPA